jgi:hypothetical protein
MRLAGSRVADQQDVFLSADILPAHQLPDRRLVDRGLGLKSKVSITLITGKFAARIRRSEARSFRRSASLSAIRS